MTGETPAVREALAVYAPEAPETGRVPPGYKQTEVGMIPEDWEVSIVGDEFDIRLGKMLDSEKNIGILKPYLGNRSVQWNKISVEDLPVMAMTHADTGRFRLRYGDLLVCEGGEVGRAAIWEAPLEECYYQKALHRLRPLRGFNSRLMLAFLRYWTSQEMLADFVSTTSIAHLTREKLATVPLPVPSAEEQRAIAAALSDVDDLISALDKLIAKKRALKTATMQQLLTGKQRLPGFIGEWETRRLGEIASITMGRTPSRGVSSFWGSGYPWLSIADLKTKHLISTKEEITEAAVANMSVIPKGPLVMSFKLTIGKLAFASRDMYSNEAICGFNDLKADAEFVYYILGRTDFSLYGKQAVKGYTLNTESLNAVEIPYPSLEEQTAIATVLSDMDAEIEALEARREKTQQVKQGMMQELLTGRTRLV